MNLYSHYLIDGSPQDKTPAELLNAISERQFSGAELFENTAEMLVDESLDPAIESYTWDSRRVDEYLSMVRSCHRKFPLPYAEVVSRCRVAEALLDAIWCKGHFRLEDLALKATWKWNGGPVGANAAFYQSVRASVDYMDALDVRLSSYKVQDATQCDISMKAQLSRRIEVVDDELLEPSDTRVRMSPQRACPSIVVPDSSSWLVYIPFDTSDYRLGGSLLAQSQGVGGGVSVQVDDPDYFMDCYEVVRELVEDGIVMSGVTVSSGGLIAAVDKLCSGGLGANIDISGIVRAFEEQDIVKVLFSEVPGVVIQIKDMDYDYVDAELLLQDVAFFPLGHPAVKSSAVRIKNSARSGIQTILDALMQNAEGED